MTAGSSARPALRVLHVVQKFSSGVGSAIAQYTHSLPEAEHHLLSGTPVDAEGDLADQGRFASVHRMDGGHLRRVRRVREVVGQVRPDVVHSHSSHGGVYARLAVSRRRTPSVYTPHCYAFERRDVAAPVRAAFWAVEALLAVNTSAVGACSVREWQLTRWPHRRVPRHLVPNIAPVRRPGGARHAGLEKLVVGGGRLAPQKDPGFFLSVVEGLRRRQPGLRAVWLGDGDPARRAALEAGGVEVTGWLPRAATTEVLGGADLYLHSARWEGFPLMVAEAAALGIPTLVRRVPCFADVPDSLTLSPEVPAQSAATVLDDPVAAAANVAAWSQVLAGNTRATQRSALLALYAGAGAPAPAGIHQGGFP
ncbi:glycosyltransferase family 4 protein [Blastococcus sp. SYSU DS0617]